MATPPCARCVRLELDCTVEPRSRRSTQRDRVRQLEDHVMQLRQNLACPANASGSSHTVESEPAVIAELPCFSEPYRLDSVSLHAQEAEELFKIFFANYHPIVPFLDETCQPAGSHRSCPFLFWSIVSVAARRYDADPTLLSRLTSPLDALLQASVLGAIKSLPQIQAVVLLGYWPLSTHRFWMNNALLYCNTALTSAMQLDLHRPGCGQEYSFFQRLYPAQSSMGERNRTWIATVLLSFSVTRGLGLPPVIPVIPDLTSELLLGMPLALRHFYTIQKGSHRIVGSLSQLELSEGLYPNLERLEEEAVHLENDFMTEMTLMNSLHLVYAKLYVQCMFFLVPPSEPEELGEKQRQQRSAGVLRAYATAVSLITLAVSHEDAFDELQFVPSQVAYILLMSALVVFRVLHSSFAALVPPPPSIGIPDPTKDRGRALCGMACFTMQRCSIQRGEDRDLASRMIDMLRKIWRAAGRDPHLCSKEPVVRVHSRMGAGIIFDCIDLWRRRYNKGDGRHQPPRTGEESANLDGNLRATQPLQLSVTSPQGAEGPLPGELPPDGSVLAQPGDWENIDWTFSDMLCDPSEDGSFLL
ncbi:Zn(II)2Cys6 transcription factor [Aspergillus lucknowensis]|uniref:Xylanolytic transcriptional activator regulatory domain-containing protein n=1 Tax=Aspergillus lucknowensis TaxID=176173 RepID=A0ABR4LRN9_9EURO